jgi:hypothetical protein
LADREQQIGKNGWTGVLVQIDLGHKRGSRTEILGHPHGGVQDRCPEFGTHGLFVFPCDALKSVQTDTGRDILLLSSSSREWGSSTHTLGERPPNPLVANPFLGEDTIFDLCYNPRIPIAGG